MDPPKNRGLMRLHALKFGHGNVGFVALRLTIPAASLMAREMPKHQYEQVIEDQGG
jgi:hypothetical protein